MEHTDEQYKVMKAAPSVDLRNKFNCPVFDQGSLGSCTANAAASALSYSFKY